MALGRGHRLAPCRARRADRVEALRGSLVPDDQRLDLLDAPAGDLQTHDQNRGDVRLANRAHQHRLPALDVREPQRVAAASRHGVPQAIAKLQPLAVLGEHHRPVHRELRRIPRDQRVHVALERRLQAPAIAFLRLDVLRTDEERNRQ
jgi:hypothetical protein